MLKDLPKSKSAFSPVIASLILMLLAVASGVVVYSYVMGWIGGATQTPGGTKGELQFDSIRADASADTVKIYVRNVGQKDLTLDKIYVDGVSYENKTTLSTNLALNGVAYIELPKSGVTLTIDKGKFYEVRIVCTDGTMVSQSVEGK